MAMGLSKAFRRYKLTSKCPLCGKFIMSVTLSDQNGKKISFFKPLPLMDRSAIAQCPKCAGCWPVFAESQPVPPEDALAPSFVETERSEESLGEEQRLIDNSASSISLTRRFTINKEWVQSFSVDQERASTIGGSLSVGVGKIANVGVKAEEAVKRKYSISEETKHTYAEEVVLDVPPKTKLRVIFHWKRLWQHGFVVMRADTEREIRVPYRVAVGLTFDQTQIDET